MGVSAIIVAGGKGIRMNSSTRKQYLAVAGMPILARTLSVFDSCPFVDRIILAVPHDDLDYCRDNVVSLLDLQKRPDIVSGGATRRDSVYNGLLAVDDKDGTVVIHDGVRPFVETGQIEACVKEAGLHGSCILGIQAFDTVKQVKGSNEIVKTLDREGIWLAQTPQAFQYHIILEAHETARRMGYGGTDDSYLVEKLGEKVMIIPGSRTNIKITTPEDLEMADALLSVNCG